MKLFLVELIFSSDLFIDKYKLLPVPEPMFFAKSPARFTKIKLKTSWKDTPKKNMFVEKYTFS